MFEEESLESAAKVVPEDEGGAISETPESGVIPPVDELGAVRDAAAENEGIVDSEETAKATEGVEEAGRRASTGSPGAQRTYGFYRSSAASHYEYEFV